MKAIVCVKQVPDTQGKVAVKADGTMDRAAMATITNPDDLNAVEAALQLKDETGCEVVVVTMGPPPAEGMLRELIARGADRGVLVSAREFGGSDTLQLPRSWQLPLTRSALARMISFSAAVRLSMATLHRLARRLLKSCICPRSPMLPTSRRTATP